MFDDLISREASVSLKERKVNQKNEKMVCYCTKWNSATSQTVFLVPLMEEGKINRLKIKLI